MKKNFILITVDCLRFDHGGIIIDTLNNQPGMKGGFSLYNVISPGPYTPMAFTSIITGTPPLLSRNCLPSSRMTLAEIFKRDGYYTFGIGGGNPSLSDFFGYNRGFDYYNDLLDRSKMKNAIDEGQKIRKTPLLQRLKKVFKTRLYFPQNNRQRIYSIIQGGYFEEVPDGELVNQTFKENFSTTKEPFFIWLHYLDAHNPYLPRPEYHPPNIDKKRALKLNYKLQKVNRHQISTEDIQDLKALYTASVKQVSAYISELLSYLHENNLLQQTSIILTADHGEAFNENGFFLHPAEFTDELLRVPFITNFPVAPDTERFNTTYVIGRIIETMKLTQSAHFNRYFKNNFYGSKGLASSSMAWYYHDKNGAYGLSRYSPCLSFRTRPGEKMGLCRFRDDSIAIRREESKKGREKVSGKMDHLSQMLVYFRLVNKTKKFIDKQK